VRTSCGWQLLQETTGEIEPGDIGFIGSESRRISCTVINAGAAEGTIDHSDDAPSSLNAAVRTARPRLDRADGAARAAIDVVERRESEIPAIREVTPS